MPKGVYARTKPAWNKGLTQFNNHSIQLNALKGSKTKQKRYKEYKNWEEEYGKEKAKEMMNQLYGFTYGKGSSDKVKNALSNMKKSTINDFVNLRPKSGSDKECREIYLVKRYIVLIRDSFTCQICGAKKKNVVHHIINKDLLEEPDLPNNMITLCISCHTRLENILSMLYYGQSRRKIDNFENYLKGKYKVPLEKARWIKENLVDSVKEFLKSISFPLETTRSAPVQQDGDIVRYPTISKIGE